MALLDSLQSFSSCPHCLPWCPASCLHSLAILLVEIPLISSVHPDTAASSQYIFCLSRIPQLSVLCVSLRFVFLARRCTHPFPLLSPLTFLAHRTQGVNIRSEVKSPSPCPYASHHGRLCSVWVLCPCSHVVSVRGRRTVTKAVATIVSKLCASQTRPRPWADYSWWICDRNAHSLVMFREVLPCASPPPSTPPHTHMKFLVLKPPT